MSLPSKQLSFPPMQNTNNSNQTCVQSRTDVPTSSNSINTEQFQCHSMIDSITESLKDYLSENLGTLKHDLRRNLRKDFMQEITIVIEQIDHDILSLGDRDSYYGPLSGDNPPILSDKSSFSHNIVALIDKGGNHNNGKEVVPNPGNGEPSKIKESQKRRSLERAYAPSENTNPTKNPHTEDDHRVHLLIDDEILDERDSEQKTPQPLGESILSKLANLVTKCWK